MWLTIQLWHSCYGNPIDIEDLAAHVIECEKKKGLSESHYCLSCLARRLPFTAYILSHTHTFSEYGPISLLWENPPCRNLNYNIPTLQKCKIRTFDCRALVSDRLLFSGSSRSRQTHTVAMLSALLRRIMLKHLGCGGTTKEINYHLDLKPCPSGDVIKMVWLPF